MNRNEKGLIAGLDEVGMGCLAGPLVIAVTAFDPYCHPIEGVRDSKTLTRLARERLVEAIVEKAKFVGLGYATVECINKVGLGRAWQEAADMALVDSPYFDLLIVDGDREVKSWSGFQDAQPKADAHHWQVSAASIIAKVMRDRHMLKLHEMYPPYQIYGWDTNVGYGSKKHNDAVIEHGPCPEHRKQYIRKLMSLRRRALAKQKMQARSLG